jgi:hypothetical protein
METSHARQGSPCKTLYTTSQTTSGARVPSLDSSHTLLYSRHPIGLP